MNLVKSVVKVFLVLGVSAGAIQAQENVQQFKNDVETLASKKMKGRLSGTKEGVKAAEYISDRFEEIGLQKIAGTETYFQKFEIPVVEMHGEVDKNDKTRKTQNVIGYIDNGGRNTIILGAHYDHLGMGYANSRYTGEKTVHFGADDNASGVAMILYLAERLKSMDMGSNIMIIAFAAEEQGLTGSKYYVNHPVESLQKATCMLNFDMVGRLADDSVMILTGTGTSPKWKSLLDNISLENGSIERDKSGLGRSDHTNFYLKEIPVLNFFTGIHDDYHKPGDDISKMDYDGMHHISDLAIKIIEEVDAVLKLTFTQTEDADQRKAWQNPSPERKKYKVTLGVIPDYSYAGEGMRIESIIPGRPASNAGMQDGDIVIQLGEVKVVEMQSYMEALSKFDTGNKTIVIFLRNGVEQSAEIEF